MTAQIVDLTFTTNVVKNKLRFNDYRGAAQTVLALFYEHGIDIDSAREHREAISREIGSSVTAWLVAEHMVGTEAGDFIPVSTVSQAVIDAAERFDLLMLFVTERACLPERPS